MKKQKRDHKVQAFFFMLPILFALNTQAQKTQAPLAATDGELNKNKIQEVLNAAYSKYKDVKEGKNADYIKELANVDSNIFGIALVTTNGQVFTAGDINSQVSIQSISKVFTMAKVIEQGGAQALQDRIGVDATGQRFNSIAAIEMHKGKQINPLVNPGAIVATSFIEGSDSSAKWKSIVDIQSQFAGRQLTLNWPVYVSEASDNLRNRAIAQLMQAYDCIQFDPAQATDIYTKQCALNVNVKDLAIMASTLANGGINPVTKNRVVGPDVVMYTLPVMVTAGMYENSGQWLYRTGLPAKGGVGGGLLAVCPGKFGIAAVSPPLDASGNSVKAQKAIQYVVEQLKADPYLIQPKQ